VTSPPVVYIDRCYEDDYDVPQQWIRRRRGPGQLEWVATTGGTAEVEEEAEFDSVKQAIAWGRERADMVLVRLGSDPEAVYSAGRDHAAWRTDGSGWRFPLWPPISWPEYQGPPEPGWLGSEAGDLDDP